MRKHSTDGVIVRNSPTSPVNLTTPAPDILLAFNTGHPLSDRADVVKCNHCKRAILNHKARNHIELCIAKKQEKQRKKKEAKDARDAAARKAERGGGSSDESDDVEDVPASGMAAKKTARKSAAGKKRKAEDIALGPDKKKKKKDEPKIKLPKAKAPIDVERQCGVELPQGGQCARSLTCKSHSMGAKRAVPGRSAPYDKLLAEYQRKNQAKLQSTWPIAGTLEFCTNIFTEAQFDSLAGPDTEVQEGPVDSDDEKDQVLAAISRARPRPLYTPLPVPLKRKYAFVRLREMLGNALTGGKPPAPSGMFAMAGGGMFAPRQQEEIVL